jgi:hypothetical protein
MSKTYSFRGFGANGQCHTMNLTARNMRVAVAKWANTANKPACMTWVVASGPDTKSYPVTRERWGHYFDGRTEGA